VHPYFDAINTGILIALSRSRLRICPVICAMLPNWLLCSCKVVSKHYAPDKNQAIHRMILCHTLCWLSFQFTTSYYLFVTVVGTSANKLVSSAYRKLMPHPLRLFGLCHRFNWRPTNTIPTWNLTRKLVSNPSLTFQCILTQSTEQGCFRPLILSHRHNSLSYVMLRWRLFSLTGEYHDLPYRLPR